MVGTGMRASVLAIVAILGMAHPACAQSAGDSSRSISEMLPQGHFSLSNRLTVEKAFAFQKTDSGGWRCNTSALQPVDFGAALSGP